MKGPFHSLYSHGFVRVAVAKPRVEVAVPSRNTEETLRLAREADQARAALVVFPELGVSAYSDEDLFFQDALLDGVEEGLAGIVTASRDLVPLLAVGAPIRHEGKLFNCAVVIGGGEILGVVPKTYLPNYREFYEARHFTSGRNATTSSCRLLGSESIPFGTDLLFEASGDPRFVVHVEVCEDVWVPLSPSTFGALAGATVLANLSASNVTIGKADYRRLLCASQSGRCIAGYLFSAAGPGESTTDLAWDGHAMIHENGTLLAESQRFSDEPELVLADLDLDRLRQDRARMTSWNDCAGDHQDRARAFRRVSFPFEPPADEVPLERDLARFPYVPSDPSSRDERCYEVYNIQVQGLAKRLRATGLERMVIGVSGGLDSTQALVVAARTADRLGLARSSILAYTLPGFATSRRTYENARSLMESLGVTAGEIDIRPAARQMLRNLGHPYSRGEKQYDVTFENVQAGERTSHLFRLANFHDAIVVGTGDLSEFALGYTTYGVGDQMAHYHVNASIPKTLVRHLIRWVARREEFGADASAVLRSILETEISPELVPGDGEKPAQRAEEKVGPYELQDFNLYYVSRYGFRPSKVAFLAHHAWGERDRGRWPEDLSPEERNEYDLATIKKWLEVFLQRFFGFSQFKRSAMPNAPKVGSGGSLSPRGDWRAPSDSSAEAWLEELRKNVP